MLYASIVYESLCSVHSLGVVIITLSICLSVFVSVYYGPVLSDLMWRRQEFVLAGSQVGHRNFLLRGHDGLGLGCLRWVWVRDGVALSHKGGPGLSPRKFVENLL